MALDSHLIHVCTIQRATVTKDAYGADRKTWSDNATGIRCRLVTKAQRVVDSVSAEYPVFIGFLLLLPAGTDVRIDDRIRNIEDEIGMIDAGPYRIEAVLPRRGRSVKHISVQLERIR